MSQSSSLRDEMSPHPFWSKAGSWQLPAFKEETMIGFCSFSHSPYHRFPNCYFISCKGWRDRGWSRCKAKRELWFGWVTYAHGLASELIPSPGFYRHTHHWGPRTCKSCTTGSAFHSLGKILPSGPCLSGGPPNAVLELAYSASEKLIVHIHSRLCSGSSDW